MSEESKNLATFAPLPSTRRGYGIHLHGHAGKGEMVYCNAGQVVIRSLADPTQVRLFGGHKCNVNVARFSPNGEWVASGDERGNVIVWGARNFIVKNTVAVNRAVLDLAWSEDGKNLVAVGEGTDKFAKAFAFDSSNDKGVFSGHSKTLLSCDWRPARPYRVVTASEDMLLNTYEGPPFKFVSAFREHTNYVNCVRYNPSGSHYVSVASDRKITLFDATSGEKVRAYESKDAGHEGSVLSVSWSPDGARFLTASADRTAKIWNVESGEVESTFTFGKALGDMQVGTLWLLEDQPISVSLSGAINYLDRANPTTPRVVLHGHKNTIRAIAVDRAARVAYSACQDGLITRWDLATGLGRWIEGDGHGKGVAALAATAGRLFSAGFDDQLRISSSTAYTGVGIALGGLPTGVAVSPDGTLAVVSVAQGKLVVVRDGAVASTLAVTYKPTSIALAADGAHVVVGGDDNKTRLYALAGGALTLARELVAHHAPVISVTFSPDGAHAVSTDTQRATYVWSVATGEVRNPNGWKFHNSKVTSVAWAPGGARIATGSTDQDVYLWNDTATFEELRHTTLKLVHEGGVEAVQWVDDNTLVTMGADRTLRTWTV